MGRARLLFTITGFWLRRMALALRMAAWRDKERAQHTHPPTLPVGSTEALPRPGSTTRCALGPLTIRRSGRYLFLRIMCRMLLSVARAFLLMVVRT